MYLEPSYIKDLKFKFWYIAYLKRKPLLFFITCIDVPLGTEKVKALTFTTGSQTSLLTTWLLSEIEEESLLIKLKRHKLLIVNCLIPCTTVRITDRHFASWHFANCWFIFSHEKVLSLANYLVTIKYLARTKKVRTRKTYQHVDRQPKKKKIKFPI